MINREITEEELCNVILPSIMERGYWFSQETLNKIFSEKDPVDALRRFIQNYAKQTGVSVENLC